MTTEQLKQALDVCSEHEACERCPVREYCGDLGIVTGEAFNAIKKLEADKKDLIAQLNEAQEIINVVTIPSAIVCEIKSILERLLDRLSSVSNTAIKKAIAMLFEKHLGGADD